MTMPLTSPFTACSVPGSTRDFIAQRRALPWFHHGVLHLFIDHCQKACVGDLPFLSYELGTRPIAGPLQQPLLTQTHAIVEANLAPTWTHRGFVQPRRKWHRVANWMGFREITFPEDPLFHQRFRVTSSSPNPHQQLHDGLRRALLDTRLISLAWSETRVAIHRPGPLSQEKRESFQHSSIKLLTSFLPCPPA